MAINTLFKGIFRSFGIKKQDFFVTALKNNCINKNSNKKYRKSEKKEKENKKNK